MIGQTSVGASGDRKDELIFDLPIKHLGYKVSTGIARTPLTKRAYGRMVKLDYHDSLLSFSSGFKSQSAYHFAMQLLHSFLQKINQLFLRLNQGLMYGNYV